MKYTRKLKIAVLFSALLLGITLCAPQFFSSAAQIAIGGYEWEVPMGFPKPLVPKDNTMSSAKVELGRHFFYDKRLSINDQTSCATCHLQEKAFTDGLKTSVGTTGEVHPRNSMSLANIAYSPTLNWANTSVTLFERHALIPMFGEDPVELGMAGKEAMLLTRINADPQYQKLLKEAYPDAKGTFILSHITQSLASFLRTIISGDSPYDKFRYQKKADAISASAKRGEELFFSERLECFDCHAGFNLSGPQIYVGKEDRENNFENNGLYNIDGKGGYPTDNTGLFEITNDPEDMGKFKVPTLRNIELTAPYMHDGSVATLEEVLDHYQAGGRTIKEGKFAGNGSKNPLKSAFVRGFYLTKQERSDLLEFLRSLTDTDFIKNPKFGDPWKK